MEREEALRLIHEKKWKTLIEAFRNNWVFEKLISDEIFNKIFRENFIRELLSEQDLNKDDELMFLSSVHTFHKSNSYSFNLIDGELEKVLMRLYQITKNFAYPREMPNSPCFKEIILENNKTQEERSRKTVIDENLLIEEFEARNSIITDSIFKSPQEKEFFYAAKKVFPDSIIIPNAALSMTLPSRLVANYLKNVERWFLLTSSVDIVVVDHETHKPTHFFELDSGYHNTPEQIEKDNMKTRLITESGYKLYRIRKKHHNNQFHTYVDWLTDIKNGV